MRYFTPQGSGSKKKRQSSVSVTEDVNSTSPKKQSGTPRRQAETKSRKSVLSNTDSERLPSAKMRYFSAVGSGSKKKRQSSLSVTENEDVNSASLKKQSETPRRQAESKTRKSVVLSNTDSEVSVFIPGNITSVVSVDEPYLKKKKRSVSYGFEVIDVSPIAASDFKEDITTSDCVKPPKRKFESVDAKNVLIPAGKTVKSTPKKRRSKKRLSSASPAVITDEPDTQTSKSTVEDNLVSSEEVEKAAVALFDLIKLTAEKRGPALFEAEGQPVYLQIACLRVPKVPIRIVRLSLPHPMITDTSDVCLFVPDLKKGPRIDHEPTVDHYRELLDKHGVKGVTQIIPVRQLKDEYFQYEMRRRLCGSFDAFLADGRICGPITPLLGKEFRIKRKSPTPVNLMSKTLKEEIEKALSKTPLTITSHGDTMTVKVGHDHHSVEHLSENIMAAVAQLRNCFPGGWHNIRSLGIKTAKSLIIPFYITMKSVNEVEVPEIKSKRPKAAVPVEDELSTIPGATVVVMPDGEVIVKEGAIPEDLISLEGLEDDEEDEEEEEEEEEEKDGEIREDTTEQLGSDREEQASKVALEDSDEDDSGVEAAEDAYLRGWAQESHVEQEEKNEEPAQKKRKQHDPSKKKSGASKVPKSKTKTTKLKKNATQAKKNTSNNLNSKNKSKKRAKS